MEKASRREAHVFLSGRQNHADFSPESRADSCGVCLIIEGPGRKWGSVTVIACVNYTSFEELHKRNYWP